MRSQLLSILAVAAAALLLVGAPQQSRAQTLRIEAESYIASHNIVPDDIHVENGVLYGLDYLGEWTRYDTSALAPGRYAVTVKFWGQLYTPYTLHLTLDNPPHTLQTVDLTFIGRGSCGT